MKLKSIEKKLSAVKGRRQELFKLREPIDRELEANYKELDRLKNALDKAKLDEIAKEGVVDWEHLLSEETSMLAYDECARQLAARHLHGPDGYFPATGQRCIKIRLYRQEIDSAKKTMAGLRELLPYIKPIDTEEYQSVRHIGIFERTLSQFGVYYLLIDEKRGLYLLMMDRHHRTRKLQTFESLEQAVDFVQKNHYYQDTQDGSTDEPTEEDGEY